jgi:SNF2 family DNA or RNA helicase
MANKLRISKQCIEVAFDNQDAKLLEQFYPVHYNRKKTQATLSIRLLPEVLQLLRGIDETNAFNLPENIKQLYYKELYARRYIDALMKNGPKSSPVVNEHLTLRPHQQLGREIAEVRDRYCFFFDTRTGKTPLSLAIINDDLQRHPEHKWLVVCPLILIENAWLPDAKEFIPDVKIISCHAPTKAKRIGLISRAAADDTQIFVTNIESFVAYREYFDKVGFTGCIVDESSVMKSNKSQQSKELVDFAHTLERFYLLSGTPAPNGEWEYFMQLRAIDYYSMPSSYTKFKEHYFINTSYNPQFEKLMLRGDRRDDLMSLIKKYALYIDKEDVLTTPGRTFEEVNIEMPKELMQHYRLLKNKLYLEVGDKQITAPSAAAKLNKLNQVSSGFVIDTQAVKENKFYDEDQQEVYLLSSYRFEALKSILALHGDAQVLIWANYRAEFEIICSMLGDKCAAVYGATKIADKNRAIQDFKSGRIRYLIANPASADKGLTLTNCHICVYFSLSWSYELFKQSMERIYGDISKQPEHCLYYVIIADGTIDEVLYHDVLQGKGDASAAVLNHLKGGC